jgi:hypothetical protein
MAELPGSPGFAPPKNQKTQSRRRAVELMATAGLTVSLVIAAAAVSLGNRSLTRGAIIERGAGPASIGTLLDQADIFARQEPRFTLKAQQ